MSITTQQLVDTFDAEIVSIEPQRISVDFPTADELRSGAPLWVAVDLAAFAWTQGGLARDLTQVDVYPDGRTIRRAYRQLDNWWYLWLYRQMQRQSLRAQKGELEDRHWQAMRGRFNALWRWACGQWGRQDVDALHQRTVDAKYRPPQPRPSYLG